MPTSPGGVTKAEGKNFTKETNTKEKEQLRFQLSILSNNRFTGRLTQTLLASFMSQGMDQVKCTFDSEL